MIIELARKNDAPGFANSRAPIHSNEPICRDGTVTCKGIDGGRLTLDTDCRRPHEINARTVDFAPPQTSDSSLIQEA